MFHIRIDRAAMHALTDALVGLPGLFARARRSALASIGHHVRLDLIREPVSPKLSPYTGTLARRHGPGGSTRYVEPYAKPRYTSGAKKGLLKIRRSTRSIPFARLKNMVRYRIDDGAGEVSVGLLKSSDIFAELMGRHAVGFSIGVTPKMRRMFFALGLPLASTTTALQVPARPWIDRVQKRWETKAGPFFEERFAAAMARYTRRI